MPCYHPLNAWHRDGLKPVFKPMPGRVQIVIPCGQCIGCRLEKSRQWAMRCLHESSMHQENCFITLTYDDAHLPGDGSLSKPVWQDFMKRFRRAVDRIEEARLMFGPCEVPYREIKFFMCGEYGESLSRPHYHACIFGFDFPDRVLWQTRDGVRLYRSSMLESLWKFGFSTVGDVTFESASYVARYILKKVNLSGKSPDELFDHYLRCDVSTGEAVFLQPEFSLMSRGGRVGKGISHSWFQEFKGDLVKDFVTVRGVKMSPARYYDYLFDIENPEELKLRKKLRKLKVNHEDNTSSRLAVKEQVKLNRLNFLKRGYENVT